MDCIVDKEEQKEEDLVKIQFIKSEKSTITWNDLTYVYEIPIKKELEFTKVYDLHLDYSFNNNKFYTLKIDYINNILPENGLVKIDVKINNNLTYANCYNQNSTLDCIIEELINEGEKPLLKLSHIKKYGSITWKNLKNKDLLIPINLTLTYYNSFNLTFINDVWNFYVNITMNEIIEENCFISIRIKYGEEKKSGTAFCYPISSNSKIYNCQAYYINQKKSDLILISRETNDINLQWENCIEEELYIPLVASLSLKRTYDLKYINEKWEFKIEVEDDLPNNSILKVDVFLYNEDKDDVATCSYYNKVLTCQRDSLNQSETESFKLNINNKYGTIKWTNINEIDLIIPLTLSLKLKKAYGLFFTDVWNFYIDIEELGIVPNNSFVLVDIFQNSEKKVTTKWRKNNILPFRR